MGFHCQEGEKYALNEQNINSVEKKILGYSGLDKNLIQQKNVKIGEFNKQPVYIKTTMCGTSDKPTLLICHGYGGSGVLFYKIMKPLAERFYVILIDVIGMGGSSRPKDFKEHKFSVAESI